MNKYCFKLFSLVLGATRDGEYYSEYTTLAFLVLNMDGRELGEVCARDESDDLFSLADCIYETLPGLEQEFEQYLNDHYEVLHSKRLHTYPSAKI